MVHCLTEITEAYHRLEVQVYAAELWAYTYDNEICIFFSNQQYATEKWLQLYGDNFLRGCQLLNKSHILNVPHLSLT
jgi:hypothetical protein